MERLKYLMENVHSIERDAHLLRQVYQKEFTQTLEIGLRFDILQNDTVALKHALVTVTALNRKLVMILNSFQDPLLTMLHFVNAMCDESKHAPKELLRCLYTLARKLDMTLDIISEMKTTLHDTVIPKSKYTQKLENEFTKSVENLVQQSTATDFVMAARNFALVDEASICADELNGFLLPLYNQSSMMG